MDTLAEQYRIKPHSRNMTTNPLHSPRMTPRQRYQRSLGHPDISHDPVQEQAIALLQGIYEQLVESDRGVTKTQNLMEKLRSSFRPKPVPRMVRGAYLWGGVGRGKTWLMDNFHDSLPFEQRTRIHFHRFMRDIHAQLKALPQQQDPLRVVANRIADRARVVCLDEFFVLDITDAMLLARLLEQLFVRRVTLVTTSNIPPDQLYKDGLQRARFLPAIDLINRHMQVFHLDAGTDYRLRQLQRAEIYHSPLDQAAEQSLQATFAQISLNSGRDHAALEIEGRDIPTRKLAEGVVWFDFRAICDGPRGTGDYIEIARCYHTVLISDVPVMNRDMEDAAHRFLNLVDEFYDHNVKLIVSAAAPVEQLYQGRRLSNEYARVRSRLHEMQSYQYLARQHLP